MSKFIYEGVTYTIEVDAENGEVEIWRDADDYDRMARVDIVDVHDLLAGYVNNATAKATEAIRNNYRMYRSAEHNWFEPKEDE